MRSAKRAVEAAPRVSKRGRKEERSVLDPAAKTSWRRRSQCLQMVVYSRNQVLWCTTQLGLRTLSKAMLFHGKTTSAAQASSMNAVGIARWRLRGQGVTDPVVGQETFDVVAQRDSNPSRCDEKRDQEDALCSLPAPSCTRRLNGCVPPTPAVTSIAGASRLPCAAT